MSRETYQKRPVKETYRGLWRPMKKRCIYVTRNLSKETCVCHGRPMQRDLFKETYACHGRPMQRDVYMLK